MARRAFRVEDSEDIGPHYFLELTDHSVLHLQGDYLYDYEPIEGDPEANTPRRFPCTEFSLRKGKHDNGVAQIVCQGDVMEPESNDAAFEPEAWRQDWVPEDGEVITDISYEELKQNHGRRRLKV